MIKTNTNNDFKVYTLSSSENPTNIRYVGYTYKRLTIRLREHKSESKVISTHKNKWIQQQLKLGNEILIIQIDSATTVEDIKLKEINHIKHYKNAGFKLTNGTDGGDGAYGFKQTDKQKELNSILKSKRIFVFDFTTGDYLYEYSSCTKLCKELLLNRSTVNYVLSGENYSYKNLWFSHTKEFKPTERRIKTPWNKGISTIGKQKFKATKVVISKDEEIISFDTVKECALFFGFSHPYICKKIESGTLLKGYKISKVG